MAAIVSKNRQDANLTTQRNLHETVSDHNNENNKGSQQVDMCNDEDNESDDNTKEQWPNYLPEHNTANKSDVIEWGKSDNGSTIFIQTASIVNACDEIISWKKNVFLVPYGRIGRDFVDLLTMYINQWNNKSDKQQIALKAFFVLLSVGLQKPGPKSKAKDHKECLKRRIVLWKN